MPLSRTSTIRWRATRALAAIAILTVIGTGCWPVGDPEDDPQTRAAGQPVSVALDDHHDQADHDHADDARQDRHGQHGSSTAREDEGLEDDIEACPGGRRVKAVTDYVSCTHGPDGDHANPGPNHGGSANQPAGGASAPAAVAAAACEGDGVSGRRVEVLYVHGSTDRHAQYLGQLQGWAAGMDDIYNRSAGETGGERHLRFVTVGSGGACQPVIRNVAVTDDALSSFGGSINAVRAQGYNRADRKYVLFADASVYCGIGEFANDSRKTDANRSNSGPSYSRVDSRCWSASTAAHELGHTLGAVSNSAANSSGGGHCTDEWDVMCYSDTPDHPTMRYVCADRAHDSLLDCNHDDYYSTNPPAGSYLATHFNVADNLFLIRGSAPTDVANPLINGASARCLDDHVASGANGTGLVVWDCQPPPNQAASQLWTAVGGTLQTQGKCLDASGRGTDNWTPIILWDCHGGANQQWTQRPDGSIFGVESGRCVGVVGGETANGSLTVLWDCNGQPDQRWSGG